MAKGTLRKFKKFSYDEDFSYKKHSRSHNPSRKYTSRDDYDEENLDFQEDDSFIKNRE